MITVTLASLLSASLVALLILACRGPAAASRRLERHDYSYVPLNDINGDAPRGKVKSEGPRPGNGAFELEDSDSQDEIWSQPL